MNNVAVILAAGNSTRMKSAKSKLLFNIDGKTVIERTVEAFAGVKAVDRIVLVGREQDIAEYKLLFKNYNITYIIGGSTRQQSVKNAVRKIDGADLIIIHDGARPIIRQDKIEAVIKAAAEIGGAAVGVPVKDTIKTVGADSFITGTPDRSTLYAVQTPQAFDFTMYKKALAAAEAAEKDFTDDCGIVEFYGGKIKMITGDYSNIKITTPDDIVIAENLLKNEV